MTIKTKLDFREFLKVQYALHLKIKKIAGQFGLFLIALICTTAIFNFRKLGIIFSDFHFYKIFFLSFLFWYFIFSPILLFIASKKQFQTNQRLNEEVTYLFTTEKIISEGESFQSECSWNKVFKIEEINSCFLIYEGVTTFRIISKRIMSIEQIIELREFLGNVPVQNIQLKK